MPAAAYFLPPFDLNHARASLMISGRTVRGKA
jgi:hypothetical protein